jgi:uncharacterized membrane protein
LTDYFWFFLFYSFVGFVLEVFFARATRNPKKDRKCLYFLPLCPVYGFGALLILFLPPVVQARPLLLFLCGGLTATAAEFLMGLFYERVAKVRFWDYGHLPLNLGGQVCLLFTAMWGLLSLGLVYGVQPLAAWLVALVPYWLTLPAALFLALDVFFTLHVLRREKDTRALLWYHRIPHRETRPL